MRELIHDDFYETLKEYDRLAVDYCLLESAESHQGFISHKEAVLYAMNRLQEEYTWISIDKAKATAEISSSEILFSFPNKPWKKSSQGTTLYKVNYTSGEKIPYWYAFLEPPQGTGPVIKGGKAIRDKYSSEDFQIVNKALFPNGTAELEVYEWSTDWSSYFDAGHEWWGTLCYSIYDKRLNRYAVLLASETD